MEKVQFNSIDKKKMDLNNLKMTNHPPSRTFNVSHKSVYTIYMTLGNYWKMHIIVVSPSIQVCNRSLFFVK